jgi:hypothetical protein
LFGNLGLMAASCCLVNVDGQFHYWRILGPHMANEAPE